MVPVHLFGAGAQNMTSFPAEYDILREIWGNICYNLGRNKVESQERRIAAGAIRKRGTGSYGTAERVAVQAALSGKSPDEALDGDRGIAVHRDSSKCCFFRHRCVGTGCRSREAAAMRASDGTFLFEIRPEPLSKRLRSFIANQEISATFKQHICDMQFNIVAVALKS